MPEKCLVAIFSQEVVSLELHIWGAGGMQWEVRGESSLGGRCHDNDMDLDRWGAANDE